MTKKLLCSLSALIVSALSVFGGNCSDCHPALLDKPFQLTGNPPLSVMSSFASPCNDYNRTLEEWYYTESFFNTIEGYFVELEKGRVEISDFQKSLALARDQYRRFLSKPVTSLAEFKKRASGLRYEMGKTYQEVKVQQTGLYSRNVFGIIIIATLFIFIALTIAWKIVSGPAEVHPPHPEIRQAHAESGKEAMK
jgi:hypothetical protein